MERNILRQCLHAAKPIRKTPLHRIPPITTLHNAPQKRYKSNNSNNKNDDDDDQAYPLTGYWADILSSKPDILSIPKQQIQPLTPTAPSQTPTSTHPKTDKEERVERARIVFGSRLASPLDRRTELEKASQNVAGVMVPPKPDEPDNCCMSGCVNCVWDVYRDEIEEWAAKSAEARERLLALRREGAATGVAAEPGSPTHVASSMDDDGGGSESNWEGEGTAVELGGKEKDLFGNVPVGIREFMRTEKMLKKRHAEEASVGG